MSSQKEMFKYVYFFLFISYTTFPWMEVCFANNPLSGFLILIGLGLADVTIAIGGFVGPFVAVLTGLVSQS